VLPRHGQGRARPVSGSGRCPALPGELPGAPSACARPAAGARRIAPCARREARRRVPLASAQARSTRPPGPRTGSCCSARAPWTTSSLWPRARPRATRRPNTRPGATPPSSAPGRRCLGRPRAAGLHPAVACPGCLGRSGHARRGRCSLVHRIACALPHVPRCGVAGRLQVVGARRVRAPSKESASKRCGRRHTGAGHNR